MMSHVVHHRVARGLDAPLRNEDVLPEVGVRPRDGDAVRELGELREPAQARRRDVRVRRAPRRCETWIGEPSRNAPPPRDAHQRCPSAGAETTPTTISPSRSSAISVAQTGSPRAYCFVPSIGSSHQRTSASATPYSSPATASPRSRAMRSRKRLLDRAVRLRHRRQVGLRLDPEVERAVALHRQRVRVVGERERVLEVGATSVHRADSNQSSKPVADAPHVDDERPGIDRLKLATQARRMRVERARPAERPEAPDLAQQLLLREHALRVARQLQRAARTPSRRGRRGRRRRSRAASSARSRSVPPRGGRARRAARAAARR